MFSPVCCRGEAQVDIAWNKQRLGHFVSLGERSVYISFVSEWSFFNTHTHNRLTRSPLERASDLASVSTGSKRAWSGCALPYTCTHLHHAHAHTMPGPLCTSPALAGIGPCL